jgi:transcriptional regulator with XRE-family HTH domain
MLPTELQSWRKQNGYSQSHLARALGVVTITISRWERGEREIPPFLHLALQSLKKRGSTIKRGRPVSGISNKRTFRS